MATTERLSIRPSDGFQHGGGLINDVDVTIKQARWVIWDYAGKSQKNTLAAHITYVDEDKQENDAYYSAGDPESFQPGKRDGGKTLDKIGKREQLSDSTNFFQFISSVVNAGYPEDMIDGSDITFLEGLKVHVLREAQPERKGIAKDPADTREKTVLCVSKIYNLPKGAGAGAKGTGTGTTKAAAGKGNGAAVEGDLESNTVDAVLAALAEANGSLTKPRLSQALFKQLKGNPDSQKMITLSFKDDFLAAEGRPWIFNGTEISMG